MLDLLKLRIQHGYQAVPDIRKAVMNSSFRGFPTLKAESCPAECSACIQVCPADAIQLNPLKLDLGKCTLCGDCQRACPHGVIDFTIINRLGSTARENLIITPGLSPEEYQAKAIEARQEIKRLFGRSLQLRQVSAGGCNGCELEMGASGNVNFDMGRFGINFVASPRHADGIVFTGPITKNMSAALKLAYQSISTPKIVIAVGACAISGGLFTESDQLDRSFLEEVKVDLYIPGCPTHPLTFINAVLDFLGHK